MVVLSSRNVGRFSQSRWLRPTQQNNYCVAITENPPLTEGAIVKHLYKNKSENYRDCTSGRPPLEKQLSTSFNTVEK